MDRTEKNTRDYYVVDMAHVVKAVWNRVWVVVFASILTAVLGFVLAAFAITPSYSSSVMLYVNNGTGLEDLGFSISSSELTAAQSLAKTYTVLLKNRTTLEKVIERTGLNQYDWEDLYDMIESGPVNETEVLRVTVTCASANHAYRLTRGITEVLPMRVGDIIKDATMEVVDYPIIENEKVAPSITAYTATGFFLGAVLSVMMLVILALMDNTVHDDDYVIKAYDYPILAKIPSLTNPGNKRYGYAASRYGTNGGNSNG